MLKISIVEDSDKDFEILKSHVENFFNQQNEVVIDRFENAELFLSVFSKNYNICFFDIELPGINGLDLARKIREIDENVPIIFITNMAQFAIQGYEVNALDYIVKPLKYGDFEMKMKKVDKFLKQQESTQVAIQTRDGVQIFKEEDIYFVEVYKHYLNFHTKRGEFTSRGTMKNAEQILPSNFARSGISFLINIRWIDKVTPNSVIVNGVELPLTRLYKNDFLKKVSQFVSGNVK